MSDDEDYAILLTPREGVNDDVVYLVQWLAAEGEKVWEDQPVVTLETTKATFDLEAPTDGYLFPLANAGVDVPVGTALALIAAAPTPPKYRREAEETSTAPASRQVVTKPAQALIEQHGLSPREFVNMPVVRASDVEEFVRLRNADVGRTHRRMFGDADLDPEAEWDEILQDPGYLRLRQLLTELRKRMRAKFNRHVPTGSLLYDRWDLAVDCRFGEGTSVYDECLILGQVKLGRYCWVGPYTILDASQAPLIIGDYVDVGAGAHLYTHNTIERALTGHKARVFARETTIGSCCFIAPQSIVAPGTRLGDHCFVAANSYVEGVFPSHSYIAGSPARRIGEIHIDGDRAKIRHTRTADRDSNFA